MAPRLIRGAPKAPPKQKEKLSASMAAWTELIPYMHDFEQRLTEIGRKQDQLLFLLAQIAKDVDEKRKR